MLSTQVHNNKGFTTLASHKTLTVIFNFEIRAIKTKVDSLLIWVSVFISRFLHVS